MEDSKSTGILSIKLMSHQKPSNLPPRYVYSKIDVGKDIRLLTLLPGEFHDPIRITIFHAPLIMPDQGSLPSTLRTEKALQSTLPKGWEVFQTPEDTFLFLNNETKKTSWTHPTPGFDPSFYQQPEDYPYPGFEPKYEALSYTWGSSKKTDVVLIEDPTTTHSLDIGQNLAAALRHLRYKDKPRTLWNDVICINQQDLNEKSEQVSRMASVYKMAYRVVVWLGSA
jgi:hypothetical protein